ncbi:MAG: DUF362 domain-containing protein [Clostridia bacterium]|nr:DUF362 domain-containing protein [Clostridia bacterium]
MEKAKVYFSSNISEEELVKLYDKLDVKLKGKVAVKVHSGEEGNQNYLHPEFLRKIVEHVNGTIVECNTAYEGKRNTTEKHKKLIESHGWNKYFDVDIMDADGESIKLDIPNGKVLKENYCGKNLKNYDSLLVVSHFKGHPMGGYGGALKQLSIGCASSEGKAYIHSGGRTKDQYNLWNDLPEQKVFLQAMADSASSVTDYFKGNIVFINIMCNMSVDCDCCSVAEDPCMKDIGVLASTDPVAIDKACIDLVMSSSDPGKEHFMERVSSRQGTYTIDAAETLGVGSTDYILIPID